MLYIINFKKIRLLLLLQVICISCFGQQSYPGFNNEVNARISGDTNSKFRVTAIHVSGNNKTKKYIILREITVREGDSIQASKLYTILEASKHLIYNTNLFNEVDIQPVLNSAYEITLHILVKERWYIFPTPQFKLVDRNLNEWIKVYNADFNRVIYGGKFAHYNFSGRGDQLRVLLLNGYARSVLLSYTAPYSNPALTEGFSVAAGFTQAREFPYKTSYNNKLLQFRKDGFERSSWSVAGTYRIRRGYFKRHLISASYTNVSINDSILDPKYNPNYFDKKTSSIGIPEFSYAYQYINTDNVNYPLKGKIFSLVATKRGLGIKGGINMLSFDATYRKYYSHKRNFYSTVELLGKIKAPFRQAYINQRALGYNDQYLRGLEYYVIDGVAAAVTKYTLSKKILSFRIPVPFKIKEFPYIPFTFFAKAYTDAGICLNKNEFNSILNNRFLYSGGFGLDVLTLYDVNLRLEYSFNQLGEKGLFLHARSSL